MPKYKVSVVIPVYNAERTIADAVNSVLHQTLEDVQIVLVDDGSTDSSGNILDEYGTKEHVVVTHQKNSGVSAARNTGINKATGDYVFFLDSDDFLDPDALEKLWRFADKNKLDMVGCSHTETNSSRYTGNNQSYHDFIATNPDEIAEKFFYLYPQSACAKLFNIKLIQAHGIQFPPKMNLGEDLYFTYSFINIAKRIGNVENAYYRVQNVNPYSLSKKYVPDMEADLNKQYYLWKELLESYPKLEEKDCSQSIGFVFNLAVLYVNNFFRQGCPFSFLEKVRKVRAFLKSYPHWIQDAYPHNRYEKVLKLVISTHKPTLICLFFALKEYVKKKRFNRKYRGIARDSINSSSNSALQ